ncbi:MAG: NAD(P)H-dependent oxidoreductase [Aeromonas sp.]
MKVLIVYAHPEPQSFNGALFNHAIEALEQAGHSVMTSDLYAMGFDPISDRRNFTAASDPDFLKLQLEELAATERGSFAPLLEQEIQKLEAADLLIFQFPLWWFTVPAILKGWVDRVFAMGRAYGQGQVYQSGKFAGKRALLSLTTGGPAEAYLPDGFNGDINGVLRPIARGMLQFVGFEVLRPQIYYAPVRVTQAERELWLAQWRERLTHIEHETPIEIGLY